MIVFLSLLAIAALLTLFNPVWRSLKVVYHRKVPRLDRGEPITKFWHLLAKTALSAIYGAGFLLFLSGFLVTAYYLYSAHQGVLVSTLACPKDPGDFSWLWLGIIVPLALFYCIIPLTSAWATPLKRHIFRRNRLYWIADQPIYIREGAFNFDRRPEDESSLKDASYNDLIKQLKDTLIHKDASFEDINKIRARINFMLESLATNLSSHMMKDEDNKDYFDNRGLSYLHNTSRGKFSRRTEIEMDDYPTFNHSKSQRVEKR